MKRQQTERVCKYVRSMFQDLLSEHDTTPVPDWVRGHISSCPRCQEKWFDFVDQADEEGALPEIAAPGDIDLGEIRRRVATAETELARRFYECDRIESWTGPAFEITEASEDACPLGKTVSARVDVRSATLDADNRILLLLHSDGTDLDCAVVFLEQEGVPLCHGTFTRDPEGGFTAQAELLASGIGSGKTTGQLRFLRLTKDLLASLRFRIYCTDNTRPMEGQLTTAEAPRDDITVAFDEAFAATPIRPTKMLNICLRHAGVSARPDVSIVDTTRRLLSENAELLNNSITAVGGEECHAFGLVGFDRSAGVLSRLRRGRANGPDGPEDRIAIQVLLILVHAIKWIWHGGEVRFDALRDELLSADTPTSAAVGLSEALIACQQYLKDKAGR